MIIQIGNKGVVLNNNNMIEFLDHFNIIKDFLRIASLNNNTTVGQSFYTGNSMTNPVEKDFLFKVINQRIDALKFFGIKYEVEDRDNYKILTVEFE